MTPYKTAFFILLIFLLSSIIPVVFVPQHYSSSILVDKQKATFNANNSQTYSVSNLINSSSSVNINTQLVSGPVNNSFSMYASSTSTPMYYSSITKYPIHLFTPYVFTSTSPANISLNISNNPIFYGFDFNKFNSSLQVTNVTLSSPGASGNSSYSFNATNGPNYSFTSQGSGGLIWSNFTIASMSHKKILNPFDANLMLNFSFNLLNAILPTNGLVYSLYIDLKFNVNTSLITAPFPSVFRLYLLYTPNYANFALHSLSNDPYFQYYVNSNSSIFLFLNQSYLNKSIPFSLNISDIFNQISSIFPTTSFEPYYTSFKGVEMDCFSQNSSSFRKLTLDIHDFTLYNSFIPSNWVNITGTAQTDHQSILLDNSLLKKEVYLMNAIQLKFQLNFNNTYLFDLNLFNINKFLVLSLNISYFKIVSFTFQSYDLHFLYCASNITNFPFFTLNNNLNTISVLFQTKNLMWLIDKSWYGYIGPTINNHRFFNSFASSILNISSSYQVKDWFGGLLDNNFSSTSFTVEFNAPNSFSLFTIQANLLDNVVYLTFSNVNTLQFSPFIQLFENNSNSFINTVTGFISSPKNNFFTLTLPIDQLINLGTNFILVAYSKDPFNGFIIQSFSLQAILSLFSNNFSCLSSIYPDSVRVGESFQFSLNCSFLNNHYSSNYMKTILINITFLNSSQLFQFSNFSLAKKSMFFETAITVPLNYNLNSSSVPLNYSVRNLAAFRDQFHFDNFSLVNIIAEPIQSSSLDNIYSPWPFYFLFSSLIFILILFRRKKLRSIAHSQIS